MKLKKENLRSIQTALLLSICIFASSAFAQKPQFVGRAGCATATCHGGLIGDGPVWHSSASRWESSDPHRVAGELLLSDSSRQIVAGLDSTSTQDATAFTRVLGERCVSCHAPEAISTSSDDNQVANFRSQLSRGVGCESCHGPASAWETLHTQVDWPNLKRLDPSVGMRETELLLARVDNCSRCHVGSRTEDESIRDMNHDMIAAGHPAFAFDMYRYESALPAHWGISKSGFNLNSPTSVVSHAAAARARVLSSAAKLSIERMRAKSPVPQPELSEFDCTACHHQLLPNSPPVHRPISGFPSWNAWLTVSNSLSFATDKMRLNEFDLEKRIAIITHESDRRAELLLIEHADPLAFLQSSLAMALNDPRHRSQIAKDGKHVRAWFNQMEIAAYAASMQMGEDRFDRLNAVLNSFRKEKLRENSSAPNSQHLLYRVDCNAADIESFCLALKEVMDGVQAPTNSSRE